jgi:hypothetical protein
MAERPPIELPPEVAQAFVEDMRAYFAEPNPIRRDEIAAYQLHVLARFSGRARRSYVSKTCTSCFAK